MISRVQPGDPAETQPRLTVNPATRYATAPAAPPARHWPDQPTVVAGLDRTGGGSWLGMNDQAVVAALMNRIGSLGPAPGKRSRSELVLEALDHAEAKSAVGAQADLDPNAY